MRLNPWTIRAADSPIGLAHDALDLRAGAHELLDLAQAAPQPKAPPDAQQTIRREVLYRMTSKSRRGCKPPLRQLRLPTTP